MNDDVSFGAWVSRRRRMLDMTREELARCAGCSVSALRKIEGDERRPSRQLAELLAGCLQIPAEEHPLFLEVARGLRRVDRLVAVPPIYPPREAAPASPRAISQIPALPAPLIGREMELAALARLLGEPSCRLLTLTGPGGIGKTSLAVAVAARQDKLFADGACFVPLASVTSSRFLVPAIADAIGCAFAGPLEPQEQLLNCLCRKSMLLVLDNLEHLIDGTEVLGAILEQTTGVKLLVTSRERLNLTGEWLFDLQGLPVPPADHAERAEEYSAVALFAQSARRIRHDFILGVDERRAVTRICELVQGMPLAIELAAAWLRVLTCAEIAAEMERSLDFLAGSPRDAAQRQRSLRATFDHSWNLLTAEERRLLGRLAIFQGGFDRAAAMQVAGATLPLLAALVDKSLLRRTAEGRYDLHEVVRQYALTYLAESQEDETAVRSRHGEYYLELLHNRDRELRSAAQRQVLRELVTEIHNIRTAWAWAIAQERFDIIGPALRAYGCLCELGGWLREGCTQLELVVQAAQRSLEHTPLQKIVGEALAQQGLLYFRWGKFTLAMSCFETSLDLLRPFAEPDLLLHPLLFQGIMLHLSGEVDQAGTVMSEALACARQAGNRWFEAYAIYNLGYIASLHGQYEQGYQQMGQGLAIWRAIGEPRSIALGLNYMSPTVIRLGRFDEAQRILEEALALCEQVDDRWGKGSAVRFTGLLALEKGDAGAAEQLFRRSLEIFGDYVIGWDIIRAVIYRGEAVYQLGRLEEARRILSCALVQAQDAHSLPLALDALAALAEVHLRQGAAAQAWRIAAFVAAHPTAPYEARQRAGRVCSQVSACQAGAAGVCEGESGAPATMADFVAAARATLATSLPGEQATDSPGS